MRIRFARLAPASWRQTLHWLGAFLLIFAALTAWRWEVLTDPPTWDTAARGLWLEASFLADTDFDYARLRDREQNPVRGGAKVYMTSLLPTFVAGIMLRTASPESSFMVYHLFTFACAAGILLMAFAILRPLVGPACSILACAALVTTPLFSAQIDLLGMELPMVAIALVSSMALWRHHYGWAAVFSTLSSLMKFTGTIIAIANLGFLLLMLVIAMFAKSPERRNLVLGVLWNGLALILQLAILYVGGIDHELIRPTGV